MGFEYDPAKSAKNLAKHGVDFEQAQALWDDPDLLTVKSKFIDEERWISIGVMAGKYWTAVWTPRGGNTRIISVRRSRDKEVQLYESHNR